MMKIGIISDTHGFLREEIIGVFGDCSLIFHAGDIGKPSIIHDLETIAPVVVVKGNNDKEEWAQNLPNETYTEVGSKMIYMIHDLKESQVIFQESKIDIVISGHSHIYKEEQKENILYLNPGGAGPKRFGRLPTVMVIEIEKEIIKVQKMILVVSSKNTIIF